MTDDTGKEKPRMVVLQWDFPGTPDYEGGKGKWRMPLDEAQAMAKEQNKSFGEGSHWVREVGEASKVQPTADKRRPRRG